MLFISTFKEVTVKGKVFLDELINKYSLSDHFAVFFSVKVPVKEPCKFRCVTICKLHKINVQEFR